MSRDEAFLREQSECIERLHAVEKERLALNRSASLLAAERVRVILALIKRFGWSQRDVAAELGVSQAAVCKTLRRRR